ncbi:hypothetical protein JAO78_007450 [Alishewanella sp. 16-MA]|uniref:Phospholipase D-like domain-containing protein n=1 Tax=Alishewanella maricola TaxID=2795740 RepID=A0ABS8C2T2_9ALTE|nr:hypothetical protein [Alishewanella maricola]MCB5226651.1 hypothetical protein [Alishewanella maricola]
MSKYQNLNHLTKTVTDMGDNTRKVALDDCSVQRYISEKTKVAAYFKNLEAHLIHHIKSADAVVGCIAWLTSENVLKALSEKIAASVIIQKEDFLRPDINSSSADWKTDLRTLYDAIKPIRTPENGLMGWYETSQVDDNVGIGSPFASVGIRCVGYSRGATATQPRMHHKFLVFLRHKVITKEEELQGLWPYLPYAVWTGSFNVTKNGAASLENALYLEDPVVSEAFCNEWTQMVEISESLDWHSEYATPEVYFNTGACLS